LQTDGGLKTGLDVIKAAILGAESSASAPARWSRWAANTCASAPEQLRHRRRHQNDKLRKEHFIGLPTWW